MKELRNLIDNEHELSVRRQCELLTIQRSGLYYKPCGEKPENLEIMRIMDEHYLKHPTAGVIRMQDLLFALGFIQLIDGWRRRLSPAESQAVGTETVRNQKYDDHAHTLTYASRTLRQ